MCVMAGGAAACGVCHVACIIKISVIENSVNCRHISVGAKGVCACGAEVVRLSPSRDPCRRPPSRRQACARRVALRTCSARRAALR
jgi:hypothetical protein